MPFYLIEEVNFLNFFSIKMRKGWGSIEKLLNSEIHANITIRNSKTARKYSTTILTQVLKENLGLELNPSNSARLCALRKQVKINHHTYS